MNKRRCCVEWTVENFVKFAVEHGGNAYFWTFTTLFEADAHELGGMWNAFRTRLTQIFGRLDFIRVIEPHKSGDRFHLHVLFNRWFDVNQLRRLGAPLGFGRMQVERVYDGNLGQYLAKYFSKGRRLANMAGVKTFSANLKAAWNRVRLTDIEFRVNGQTWLERFGRFLPPGGVARARAAMRFFFEDRWKSQLAASYWLRCQLGWAEITGHCLQAEHYRRCLSAHPFRYEEVISPEAWR